MNLANKLTVLRVLLVPIFIVLVIIGSFWANVLALLIFIGASITDYYDGVIARKQNMITTLGIFLDPLADKLLVCSAMIGLIELGRIPSWIVIVIIAREFVISGFRLIASDNGRVIAASYWGKFKTTFQMIMVLLMIADIQNNVFYMLTQVIMWIALALTIISLVDYLVKNKDVMNGSK